MTFSPSFGRIFSPSFKPNSLAEAGGDWWLSGGISSNCAVVYQPKGAADIDSSKINLVSPGTNNAIFTGSVTWDVDDGWIIAADSRYVTVGAITGASNFYTNESFCIFIRATATNSTGTQAFVGIQSPLVGAAYRSTIKVEHYSQSSYTLYNDVNPSTICINGLDIYFDGEYAGTRGSGWASSTSTKKLYMGYLEGYFWGRENVKAFSLYTANLTADQILALHTASMAL